MAQHTLVSLSHLPQHPMGRQVTIAILHGRFHRELTELIARLALRGPFHFIVGGEWVPDQDSMRRAVHRYTNQVYKVLDHPILGRPSTCLQLQDQLNMADAQPYPILITNFLNRFFDPDVNLTLRQRVLEECCRQVQVLSKSRSVYIMVEDLPIEDHQAFFPIVESVADEILEVKERPQLPVLQYSLL